MISKVLKDVINFIRNSVVAKAGIWYTAGNIAARAIGFLSIPLFTRLLTPAEYGTVAIMSTWLTIFFILSSLYTYAVPIRARVDFEDNFGEFISSLTTLGILSAAIFATILFLLPRDLIETTFELPRNLILLVAVVVIIAIPYRIKLGVWQAESNARRYISTTLSASILTIGLSIALIFLPEYTVFSYESVYGRIGAILGIFALFGLIHWPLTLRGRTFFRWEYWRYAIIYAVPLIPHALSGEILANFDRVMISQYEGVDVTGIYSYGYQIGAVVALIAASLAAAYFPWLYRQLDKKNYDHIQNRSNIFIVLFTLMTICLIIAGVIITPLLAPEEYAQAVFVTPVVMAGGFFVFLQYFFIGIETNERKTWYTSVATLLVAGLNIALNWYFIPRYGFLAAAWTTLISYIFLFIVHVIVVRLVLKIEAIFNLKLMLLMSGCILCVVFLSILPNL